MMPPPECRCGVIAIVGEPNAGKSTLINRLVGGKVSIVTPRVQTTRFNVRGVCAQGDAQFIFVDTPGIFEAAKPFEQAMVRAAWAGIGDADAVLLVLDATQELTESATSIMERLADVKKPVYLAINKIDRIKKDALIRLAAACDKAGAFERIFMVSALKGDGVEDIKKEMAKSMPQAPWLYPQDEMSDIPLRLLAAEITREKLFMALGQELPYALLVETESWEENSSPHRGEGGRGAGLGDADSKTQTANRESSPPNLPPMRGGIIRISQIIYVQREGQKKIVIGAGGSVLKKIGMAARKEMEKLLDKKIHLALFVKVRANWKEDSATYRLLGLEQRK